ncbi:MAG TPA: hypothetical protein VKY22_28320 [Bradyrhizobium sp.]|nr:hypothetical protein [Bradyrhizobium sp.]
MNMAEASDAARDEARIDQAADAIRGMTNDMVSELPVRQWVIDTIRTLTLQAPLRSLAVAFLLGLIIARRRG